jgi:hypothetical protein
MKLTRFDVLMLTGCSVVAALAAYVGYIALYGVLAVLAP